MRFVIKVGDDILWLTTMRRGGWGHLCGIWSCIVLEFWLRRNFLFDHLIGDLVGLSTC